MSHLAELIRDKRTLIVVGPGGVGKTTTSASIAVRAARGGMTVLVLTVDPAKRLATSLGLGSLSNEEVEVAPELFAAAGVDLNGGRLFAMMLDTKTTFDKLIERHAGSDELRDRVFGNPFYEQASTAMAGTQEYMAMEKLYEVRHERGDRYDLIVLDTAPTTGALDFLQAADRLSDFLGSNSLKVMLGMVRTAGRFGFGLLKVNNFILRRLSRLVSMETVLGVLEFIESFQTMHEDFKSRALRVKAMFRDQKENAFIIVSSTDVAATQEGLYFQRQLQEHAMPVGAFLLNRVRTPFLSADQLDGLEEHLDALAENTPSLGLYALDEQRATLHTLATACASYGERCAADAARVAAVRQELGAAHDLLWTAPLFDQDIHDIGGLSRFADVVFEGT